jgi:regulatory protein
MEPPRSAYSVALILLSARELSETQLRARLTRRQHHADDIDEAIAHLKADRTLDDHRVARALARMETSIKHRGRARVIQKIRQAGISASIAEDAVKEVFADVDESDLLERALARRLRGKSVRDLDERGRAKIVRGLMAQGFSLESILRKF